MYDSITNDTYWYVDKPNDMVLTQPTGPEFDEGKWDAIETACHATIAYKDKRFIDGIKSCWIKTPRKYWFSGYTYKGQRYPGVEHKDSGMSRDHVVYTFVSFKELGLNNDEIWEYARHMRFNIGKELGMKMTPSLWLWLRLISGKRIGQLYYLIALLEISFSFLSNNFFDFITGGFGEEMNQNNFLLLNTAFRPPYFWRILNLYLPPYALKLLAFQLHPLKDNWISKKIKKIASKMVTKHNYLLHLMFDGEIITDEQVMNYKPMTGARWSTTLNPFYTDRILEVITNSKYLTSNTLDKDLLIEIYNKKNNTDRC